MGDQNSQKAFKPEMETVDEFLERFKALFTLLKHFRNHDHKHDHDVVHEVKKINSNEVFTS